MYTRMKNSIAGWLVAILVIALFLLPLWLHRTPMFIQVPAAILVICLGVYFAVSALRDRWRLSKSTGQFLGYYIPLGATAIVIIIAFLLLCFVIGR